MLKFKASLLSALLLVSGSLIAQEEKIDAETDKKLRESSQAGLKSFRDGRYKEAIESFSTFASLLPKSKTYDITRAHAHYYICSAHANLNQKEAALKHLELSMKYGYLEFDRMKADKDLDGIKSEKKFSELIAKYQKIALEKLQKDFAKFKLERKDLNGKTIKKDAYLGKVLMINLWGTWCPPCRAEIPHFIEAQKKYGEKGFQIIGINYEKTDNLVQATSLTKRFAEQNKINYPLSVVDSKYLGTLPQEVGGFPTTYFFGRDGKIRKVKVGGLHLSDLEAIIKPLLAEKYDPKKKGKTEVKKEEKKKTEENPEKKKEEKPAEKKDS